MVNTEALFHPLRLDKPISIFKIPYTLLLVSIRQTVYFSSAIISQYHFLLLSMNDPGRSSMVPYQKLAEARSYPHP